MMRNTLFLFLLSGSLACFGQVVSTGGYATTSGPAVTITPANAANAPLLVTPDAALPGSGPAFGAPISSGNMNDSRSSTGPSVYNPNGIAAGTEEAPAANAAQTGNATNAGAPANNPAFEFGVQQVISPAEAESSQTTSLGEVARELRAHRRAAIKVINNDSVARLNSERTGLEGLQAQDNTTVAGVSPTIQNAPLSSAAIAHNESSALPQADGGSSAPEPAQPNPTAGQQRHAASTPPSAQPEAGAESQPLAPSAAPKPNAQNGKQLPKTASYLPLLFLFGALGLAGGALFYFKN